MLSYRLPTLHVTASLSTNQVTDWIARLCKGMGGKLKPIPSKPTHKRERVQTLTGHAQPESQSVLRYKVLRVNSHYHGLNALLMYNVSWREPGSSNTMEPYARLHHLEALTEYEQWFESNPDCKDYYKALYLCERDKERDAMLSEEDTDSEMTEAEPALQQFIASTSQRDMSGPILTPSPQEQSDWEDLLESGTWMRQGPQWVMEEEMFQPPIAPVMDQAKVEPALIGPVFIGPDLDWREL
jgi:hypothetical protein